MDIKWKMEITNRKSQIANHKSQITNPTLSKSHIIQILDP